MGKQKLYTSLLLFALFLFIDASVATITLPPFFGDNMIIQRLTNVCIKGHTDLPNANIHVTLVNVYLHKFFETVADEHGSFKVCFDSGDATSQPFTVQIVSGDAQGNKEDIVFNNVLFGDVYLCSGQSNMQMTVGAAFNASAEIADANYDTLRIFTVKQHYSTTPLSSLNHYLKDGWNSAVPSVIGGPDWQYTSATCYFFGRDVYLSLNKKVPIGLLVSSYGGTVVEAWSSPDAIKKCDQNPVSKDPKNQPMVLWNAMIVPLLDMRIKAVTWYQGESNAFNPPNYACQFPAMIQDWRLKFGIEDLPFYFVQLAGYPSGGSSYAELRLSQEAALQLPNTGMSCAVDLGDPDSPAGSIHPRDKQRVGLRLSRLARALIYGQNIQYKGPTFSKVVTHQGGNSFNATIVYENQNELNLFFNGTSGCKECCGKSGTENAFELRLEKGGWVPATVIAREREIYIYMATKEKVTGVRYAYSGYPQCMVYSREGLPSPPFVAQL